MMVLWKILWGRGSRGCETGFLWTFLLERLGLGIGQGWFDAGRRLGGASRAEVSGVVVDYVSAPVELEVAAVEQERLLPGPLHPGLRPGDADAQPLGEFLLGHTFVLFLRSVPPVTPSDEALRKGRTTHP